MPATTLVSRRLFLADLGRGSVALAVVAVAGCAPSGSSPSGGIGAPATASGLPSGQPVAAPSAAVGDAGAWERVDLGFVSAYVLVRGGEAAIVDTGTAGSEIDIATALERVGLDWDAVGHVIVTHRHGDHAGSAAAVLAAAPLATGYAGAEDLDGIEAARPLTVVADGDDVFGLTIVATPGHTPGHVAVLDEAGGVLVAGDALGTDGGAVTGPNEQFTADMAMALVSVARLGTLEFGTLLVGHGDPIVGGASDLVAAFQPR